MTPCTATPYVVKKPTARRRNATAVGARSTIHALACRMLGLKHLRTRPYRPRTNGKAERFIQTLLRGWAYGAIYRTAEQRLSALPGWLDFYNHERPHGSPQPPESCRAISSPGEQPPWEPHLGLEAELDPVGVVHDDGPALFTRDRAAVLLQTQTEVLDALRAVHREHDPFQPRGLP